MWKPTISSDEIYHSCLAHSAKGSTWKDHKYIKKIGDTYIYAKDQLKSGAKKAGRAIQDKVWDAEIAAENAGEKISDAASRAKKKVEDSTGITDKRAYEGYKYDFDEADEAAKKAYENRQWHEHRERMANIYNDESWAAIERSMAEKAKQKEWDATTRKYGKDGVYDKMRDAEDRYKSSAVGKLDSKLENGKSKIDKLLGRNKKKSESEDKWSEYRETEKKALKEAQASRAERSKQKAQKAKAKKIENLRGQAMEQRVAKENAATAKRKEAEASIKKAQKKASAHDIHTTRDTTESGKKNGYYVYNFKTNAPGTSKNRYLFTTKGGRATDIRSSIENADYGAAAAAKRDSTKKRENVARELAKIARDNYKEQGLSEKWYRNKDAEKWDTVAKSASIRQKQEEAYNKKKKALSKERREIIRRHHARNTEEI